MGMQKIIDQKTIPQNITVTPLAQKDSTSNSPNLRMKKVNSIEANMKGGQFLMMYESNSLIDPVKR